METEGTLSIEPKKWTAKIAFEHKIEYNYEAMWDKLRLEMEHLMEKNVSCFHPAIVLGYMGFISQEERLRALKGE